MAKSANVTVRVEPEIKEQAENLMSQMGLPVSVVINALYRQIIYTHGIPFSMTVPQNIPTRETMTDDEFGAMLEKGIAQSESGQGVAADEAFDRLESIIDG
jgi:addiction module RelB/DinJ family antitoxin